MSSSGWDTGGFAASTPLELAAFAGNPLAIAAVRWPYVIAELPPGRLRGPVTVGDDSARAKFVAVVAQRPTQGKPVAAGLG